MAYRPQVKTKSGMVDLDLYVNPDNFNDDTKWLNHQNAQNEVGNSNRPLALFGAEVYTANNARFRIKGPSDDGVLRLDSDTNETSIGFYRNGSVSKTFGVSSNSNNQLAYYDNVGDHKWHILATQDYAQKALYIHNITVHGAIGSTSIHFCLTVYSTNNTKVTKIVELKTLIESQTDASTETGITVSGYYGSYITVMINGACNANAPVVAYATSNASSSATFTSISLASFSGTIKDSVYKI